MFTTLDRNKVTPGHMWGRIYMEDSSSDVWKSLWAAGTASRLLACSSHGCADRPGAALHTGTVRLLVPCPCPLVPCMAFGFFDSHLVLTKLHTSIPMGWGPLFLVCTSQPAQPKLHTEAASQTSQDGISFRRFWGSSKTQPSRARGFPPHHPIRGLNSSPVSLPPHQADTEVPRKCCPTPELQLVTTSMWARDISYYFHRSPGCQSGIWAVNIIHKGSWGCTDKLYFLPL